jgi:hypothetical protein
MDHIFSRVYIRCYNILKKIEGDSMKKEKTYWYDLKPSDDNKGFIYGINYIDNDEVIECEWFKTRQERNKQIEREYEK